MKIKIITCHDVYNVGAGLQAYALAEYLKSLGNEVEIINYKPAYLSNHYRLSGVNNEKYNKPFLREIYQVLKFPGRLKARFSKRKKEFDKFTRDFLPTTSRIYRSNDELKANLPLADVYIAGSDQIWNTLFNNGKDPAFYLDFAPDNAIKASYAASFGGDFVDDNYKAKIKLWLDSFDKISVRESSGVEILNDLGVNNAVQVLDPVFLLDKEQWIAIEKDLNLKDKYALIYDFDNNIELEKTAKNLAKEKNLKIYSVLPCKYADKCFDQEGPSAFVSLIHNAEFVISNSFHATAFSMIFEKKFLTFNRKEAINARLKELLCSVSFDRLYVESYTQIDYNADMNYNNVNTLLQTERKNSIAFLNSVISN